MIFITINVHRQLGIIVHRYHQSRGLRSHLQSLELQLTALEGDLVVVAFLAYLSCRLFVVTQDKDGPLFVGDVLQFPALRRCKYTSHHFMDLAHTFFRHIEYPYHSVGFLSFFS